MQDIYNAARAWLYPKGAGHKVGKQRNLTGVSLDLISGLQNFELHNRGHRHLLNDMSMHATLRAEYGSAAYKRRETIEHSINRLLRFFLETPLQVVTSEMTALLNAKDNLGWLRREVLQRLDWRVRAILEKASPKQFEVQYAFAEATSKGAIVHVTLRLRDGILRAERHLELPNGDCTTLQGVLDFYKQADEFLRAALLQVPEWPEFSQKAQHAERMRQLQQDLARMARGYSPEMRQTLAENWSTLCPVTSK